MGSFPEMYNDLLSFLTPCKVAVQDSLGLRDPYCGFWIPCTDTGFCIPFQWKLTSYFQFPAFNFKCYFILLILILARIVCKCPLSVGSFFT